MKKYVLDASAVLSMVLSEDKDAMAIFLDLAEKAENQKVELYSTVFFRHEVANGLRYSNKSKLEILEIWKYFVKLPIICGDPERNFLGSVANLSRKLGTTVYDTSYHYLAMITDGTFLTRDRGYYEKAKKLGNIKCF
ncbi:MAG: type II toxin-antitoxin system VapC family toxin [Candidatus Moranbacteria bacterium]|nr:type II toxin-antitoxin system VapC family toxin [Candidatus Moranbacteria bacterium]